MRAKPYLATLLAAALRGSSAHAGDVEEARKLLQQGHQELTDANYVGALASFRSAHARYPSIKILPNIATTLRLLGRNAEAADVYDAYLRDPGAEPDKRAKVERQVAELDVLVAKLRVEVDDPAATVRVDGKVVGPAASVVSLRVEPGPHVVSAERAEGPIVFQNIGAIAGQETQVQLHLLPPSEPPVRTEQPPPPPDVKKLGGDTPSPPLSPPPLPGAGGPSRQRAGAYMAGGVGVAGLVLGGVMGGLTLAKKGTIEANCNLGGVPDLCNHAGKVAADSAQTTGFISAVGFGLGVAGVGVATVLLLTEPKKKPAADKVALRSGVLAIGENGVVLGVRGTW